MDNKVHESLSTKNLSIVDDSGKQKILISTIPASQQPLVPGNEKESIPFIGSSGYFVGRRSSFGKRHLTPSRQDAKTREQFLQLPVSTQSASPAV